MRFYVNSMLLLFGVTSGFICTPQNQYSRNVRIQKSISLSLAGSVQGEVEQDCGCNEVKKFSGTPSERALKMNPRKVLSETTSAIYSIDGEEIKFNNLLTAYPINIVVFLRSFG